METNLKQLYTRILLKKNNPNRNIWLTLFTQPFRLEPDAVSLQVCLRITIWLEVASHLLAKIQIDPVRTANECEKDHLAAEKLPKNSRNPTRPNLLCTIWFQVHLFTQRRLGKNTTYSLTLVYYFNLGSDPFWSRIVVFVHLYFYEIHNFESFRQWKDKEIFSN